MTVRGFLLGLCCVAVVGCSDPRPSVVLITLDTTRADRIGAYGDTTAQTPNLDRLAQGGVVFERAYASTPLTLPSHTTILTGLDPNRHGVHDNGFFVVPDELETLAEQLTGQGYSTGAFLSAFVLDAEFGLSQGFAVYDDDVDLKRDPLSHQVPSRRGEKVTDRALAWLDDVGSSPYFLWAHYYDVHAPREPPPPFDKIEDTYAGELAYVDREVGRLLAAVKARAGSERTLVVVVADHGESLGDHDELTHGILAYDSTLHVPLLVAGPGFQPGGRRSDFTITADIVPTVLQALALPIPAGLDGRPLQVPAAERDQPGVAVATAEKASGAHDGDTTPSADPRAGYFECVGPHFNYGWAEITGVRTEQWKYTAEPEPIELFDILADPGELENLAAQREDIVAEMRGVYDAKVSLPSLDDEAVRLRGPSPDVQEKLEALGYVSAPSVSLPEGEVADPRKLSRVPPLVDTARAIAAEGRVADGIQALEIIATTPAGRSLAVHSLAPLYLTAGRYTDAIAAFDELRPTMGSTADIEIARALLSLGNVDEALALMKVSEERDALSRARVARAEMLLSLGEIDEARRISAELTKAFPDSDSAIALSGTIRVHTEGSAAVIPSLRQRLEADGADNMPRTRLLLAALLHDLDRDREAVQLLESADPTTGSEYLMLAAIAGARDNKALVVANLEKAVAEWPAAMEVRRQLADIYAESGQFKEALASYDMVLIGNPADAATIADRAIVLTRTGQVKEAEEAYKQALEIDAELPEAMFNLALLELQRDAEADAEQHLLSAVKLRPDFRKAHAHLAIIYGRREDPREEHHSKLAVLPEDNPLPGSPPAIP